jgi:hypothetical protein
VGYVADHILGHSSRSADALVAATAVEHGYLGRVKMIHIEAL